MGVVHGRFGGMFDSNKNGSSSKSPLARDAPDTTLTPIDQVKQNNQKAADAPHTSFLDHVANVAKGIGRGTVKAGAAVVKPIADVATGQGGKAAHDTAQLSSDVTGGALNQFTEAAAHVPQAVYREARNKPITDIQESTFHTTDPTKIAKKIVGSTAGTALLIPGGGAAAGLKAAGEQGGKELALTVAKNAAIGAGSTAAGTEAQNPDASLKEVVKNAAVGAAVGGALPVASKKLTNLFKGTKPKVTLPKEAPAEGAPAAGADNIKPLPADIANAGKGAETAPPSILAQLPKTAEGDTKAAALNRNFVRTRYNEFIKPVQQAAKGMSAKDVKLLENIELPNNPDAQAAVEHLNRIASTADNPTQFHAVVNAMRDGYNARLASDQTLGRDVGVRNNYLPHLFDTTDPETAAKLDTLQQTKARILAGNTKPGYTQLRKLDTYAQGDEMGLKRRNANVLEDFYQSMNMAGHEHGKQAMIKALNEAHPGQVQFGKIGRGTDGQNYTELHIPGARGITMPEQIAEQYNKRALPKTKGFFAKYDAVNGALKYAKLGGGLFHAFTTTGTTLGHQITSLNLLKHPIDNLRVGLGALSKTVHAANWEKLSADGADHADGLSTVDRMNLAGVTTKAKQILADANTGLVDNLKRNNPITKVIGGIHDMVFDRQIPEAKALMFKQATQHLDAHNPEDLAKMRKIASGVNNLGGINRAVEGLTPKSARQLSRVVLATDFTEGKFRTIFNGITKWGVDNPQGRMARQMIVGKSLLFALPGMAALVAHGQLDPSDHKAVADAFMSQILNPQLPTSWRTKPSKSNPNGIPISLKLPSTFISEIGKVIAPALDPLSPDKTAGIKDYASGRLAALPSVGEQVGTNRDYFGNPIHGKDKNGNPISAKQTVVNISNQVSPIPVVQGTKMAAGQNAGESAANILGFRATSDPTSAEAGHTKRITEFYNTYNSASTARKQVVKQMNDLVTKGNNAQAARLAEQYNASLDQRTMPFRSKYAEGYNPAFDQQFLSLKIPTTTRAFTSREKAIKESQAVLQ